MFLLLIAVLLPVGQTASGDAIETHIPRQVELDLRSNQWPVRRDAFERLLAIPGASSAPEIQTALIALREKEDRESNKSDPDLFEDDDYNAYNGQLSEEVQAIAVATHNPRAWRALVDERYNQTSEFADWLASHRETLPELTRFFSSPYIWRRGIACYVVASMLAKSKTDHPFPAAEYQAYKRRIRWHILHDPLGIVPDFGIEGLALTKDPEDIPTLEGFAARAKLPFDKKLALETAQAIRDANPDLNPSPPAPGGVRRAMPTPQ